MSSPKEENKGRVEVNDLPQKEEELKGDEAKEIKGGGRLGGGGTDGTPTDEEIPAGRLSGGGTASV